jgi:MFS family permease
VALLFLAASLYNIDRLIVGILAEPIRAELHISDVQMGLLLGVAFSTLSSTFGLFVGYLVDRSVRRTVLGSCILLWSGSTIAAGFAPDFKAFFVCRALVGLGEMALAPAALSLVADLFPVARRGRALSVYFLGATCGASLAALIPGAIAARGIHLSLPGLGELSTWRTSFVLCGLIGPLLGVLWLTVPEPPRRGITLGGREHSRLLERLRYLWRERRVIGPLIGGGTLFFVTLQATVNWSTTFLMRAYHLTLAELAGPLGITAFGAGAIGYLVAGMLVDSTFVRRHGGKSSLLVGVPLVALPGTLACLCPGPWSALAALSAITIATPLLNVAMNGSLQDLVPNAMRGFSLTVFGALNGLLAVSLGPLLVALATERLFGSPELIGFSLMVVGAPALLAATVCFAFSRRALRSALARGGELAQVVAASHA